MSKHSHYFRKIPKDVEEIDIYFVLKLFNVDDPCLQHAIKKLFMPGMRGSKDILKDVQEAIDSLERFKVIHNQMNIEDEDMMDNTSLDDLKWTLPTSLDTIGFDKYESKKGGLPDVKYVDTYNESEVLQTYKKYETKNEVSYKAGCCKDCLVDENIRVETNNYNSYGMTGYDK